MSDSAKTNAIPADTLRAECLKKQYIEMLAQPDTYPSENNWNYIIEHKMTGVGPGLYRKYMVSFALPEDKRTDFHTAALREFPRYLKEVDRRYALDVLYSDLDSEPDAAITLAEQCELFDCGEINRLLDDNRTDTAIDMLRAYQPEYTHDDLHEMENLHRRFCQMPATGRVEEVKGIFKVERKYICPNGHVNSADVAFCQAPGCGRNARGFTKAQVDIINEFGERILALRRLLA